MTADKLISFPATVHYIRYRNLWDLHWLVKNGVKVDTDLVIRKISDYGLSGFDRLLMSTIDTLPDIVNGLNIRYEMKQLLPADVYSRTFGKEKFSEYLLCALQGLFRQVCEALN